MNKKLFVAIVLCLLLVPLANAITGSIGNAKAIVTVDLSKSNILERTVLVKNVNDFAISVKLEPADDLELITDIIDKEFELGPGEEKKARFKVTIPEPKTYNGNIVVFFNPPEGKGAGVVLQSNLIIKAVNDPSGLEAANIKEPRPEEELEGTQNPITGSTIFESPNLEKLGFGVLFFIFLVVVVVISGFVVLMRRI